MDQICGWGSSQKIEQIRGNMKSILILVLTLVTSSVFASREIYQSLAVEEQVLSTTRMEVILQKSAGGLTCKRKDHVENGPSFSCELETKNSDEAAIYQALTSEEVLIESSRMQFVYEKTVSPLHCMKTDDVLTGESFNCKLKF